ncbi:methyltransferase domain-containing protein [Microlunatus elymi]|uniref:Methyltransferase domain-containing protein n=1 Tax=Microlunatus elymi TaxID=2596828 RepID=A0A516Q2E6_9ACTN|nr:methyltransferase domain-containing protein [Microlunatus elymi]QDP97600.1 methyltransferase domain-containing protein [Microlunatus elymi]
MAEVRRNRSRSVAGALLDDLLSTQLRDWQTRRGLAEYSVTDLGGGTGTLAIRLAEAGHPVTVIDPSLDALASLQRRITERQLADRLRGIQGDASEMVALLGTDSTDVMVCHRTLEVVDDPGTALAAMAEVVRPDGVLSLVVPQRRAAVLSQALQGHIPVALQILDDPARFDLEQVVDLVERAGFAISDISGIGILANHVPQAALEAEPGLLEALYELETRISTDVAFRAIAPWAHIFATR